MKNSWLYRSSFAALTVLICAGSALAKPKAFTTQSFQQARILASKEKKFLVVDFTASWCGPCHKMDETTWSDTNVEKWLHENAVAVQVDVDKDKEIAMSMQISAMPTVVVFDAKDTTKEFDRDTGYKSPPQLLEWLNTVKSGKSLSAALTDEVNKAVGKGGEVEVDTRYKAASKLMGAGKYAEATDHYVWLWNNILKECPAMGGVRSSFMAYDMLHLAQIYPPAREKFNELREVSLKSDNRGDWMVLNQVLNNEAESLKWFDQIKDQPDQKQTLAKYDFMLQDVLIKNKRWADVAVYLYKDPIKWLDQSFKTSQEVKKMAKDYDPFPRDAAMIYTCYLAAHLDDTAEKIATHSMHLENTAKLRSRMVTTAFNAGYLNLSQLKWLGEIRPTNEPNFYWERAMLYCTIEQYQRSLQDFNKAIASHPNAAIYCSRGYAHYMLNQDKLAMDDFDSAEKLDPKNGWSWVNKSALLYRQKKYEDAYTTANKAIELDPKILEGFCNRGEAALRLGKLEEAVADLTRAVASSSRTCSAEAHYYRALTYEKLGKADLAEKDRHIATAMAFKPAPGE